MRIIEIILKLAFLVLSLYIIATGQVFSHIAVILAYVCFLLGIVLIFNKHTSYGSWGNAKKDFVMRRIEGVILIVAALVVFIHS